MTQWLIYPLERRKTRLAEIRVTNVSGIAVDVESGFGCGLW
jgi:hypothetical protein